MKTKLLFIDRDGTLIHEPPETFQVDRFDQLQFLPGMFTYLRKIAEECDYELVMVTNQDGLGTENYPLHVFQPIHDLLMRSLEGENIYFSEVLIDKSFPHENKPTRKPGTGMLKKYMNGDYDLENSFVIGDRLSDVQLAENLGAKAIFIHNNESPEGKENKIAKIVSGWEEIYRYLRLPERKAVHQRVTKETDIRVEINLDGNGNSAIKTGIAFFDHMLEQLAKHGGMNLFITAKGDLHIDEHHTIEDTAITLGEAFAMAVGDKRGIGRYGFCLPMDDCLAQVAVDFGGRPWLEWEAEFKREKIGEMPTEMFMHFFKSFSDAARCNLNIKAEGTNEHHKIEAIFKAFAKAVKMAVKREAGNNSLPSTKGML